MPSIDLSFFLNTVTPLQSYMGKGKTCSISILPIHACPLLISYRKVDTYIHTYIHTWMHIHTQTHEYELAYIYIFIHLFIYMFVNTTYVCMNTIYFYGKAYTYTHYIISCIYAFNILTHTRTHMGESCSIMAQVLDSSLRVSEFKRHLYY